MRDSKKEGKRGGAHRLTCVFFHQKKGKGRKSRRRKENGSLPTTNIGEGNARASSHHCRGGEITTIFIKEEKRGAEVSFSISQEKGKARRAISSLSKKGGKGDGNLVSSNTARGGGKRKKGRTGIRDCIYS